MSRNFHSVHILSLPNTCITEIQVLGILKYHFFSDSESIDSLHIKIMVNVRIITKILFIMFLSKLLTRRPINFACPRLVWRCYYSCSSLSSYFYIIHPPQAFPNTESFLINSLKRFDDVVEGTYLINY